jgi:uroporphyrinogen decarboxylase
MNAGQGGRAPAATPRERVIAALDHRQPDVTPYHISFTEPARRTMAQYFGRDNFEDSLGNCLTILSTSLPETELPDRPGIWADEFGVLWDRRVDVDIGTVSNQRVTPENFRRYAFPDPEDPSRFSGFPDEISRRGDTFVVASLGFSLFERAWTLAGMENILVAMIEDKDFANSLFDAILEYDLAVVKSALSHDIDGMRFGDDWGQQRGLLMGPPLWREFLKPRIARLYAAVKAAGRKVFIHSCGKVDELFPDFIECGVDVFNPFQPEVMDVYDIKRRYGDRISFFGGISTQKTLPYGTVQQVKDEVRRLIEGVGENGGYIASPAHDIPKDARAENVAAMIEVLQGQ